MKKKETKAVPKKKKMGAPRKEIDYEVFENLCSLQCSREEICEWLKVTDKTLNLRLQEYYGDTFSVVFEAKRKPGLTSLRRTQFQLAKKSAAMAIFLGKNLLKQKDKSELALQGGLNVNKELGEMKYSDLLKEAKKRGLTLPD